MHRIVLMLASCLLVACGPKPAAPAATTATPTDADTSGEPEADPADPEPAAGPSRLTVSFGSECCGIDAKAREALQVIVDEFEKAEHVAPTRDTAHWGREGEVDECFDLTALTPQQRADFDAAVTARLGDTRLVTLTRDEPCRTDRH